jgi:hypothetical protein
MTRGVERRENYECGDGVSLSDPNWSAHTVTLAALH